MNAPGDGGGAALGRGRVMGLKLRCATGFGARGVNRLCARVAPESLSESESPAAAARSRAARVGAGLATACASFARVDSLRRAILFSLGGGGRSSGGPSSASEGPFTPIGRGLKAGGAPASALARVPWLFTF